MENYNLLMENLIKNLNHKPKLLMHSCCAPCSTAAIIRVSEFFDTTIYYYNPNIYPEAEFEKRQHEQIRLLKEINATLKNPIKIILPAHNPENFNNKTLNLQQEAEGGKRCYICYNERLYTTAIYAKKNGYEFFGTTLSVSPYKNVNWINEIGLRLEKELDTKFLVADFKKKDGYKKSIQLSTKYNLYRQDYCGCKYSILPIANGSTTNN